MHSKYFVVLFFTFLFVFVCQALVSTSALAQMPQSSVSIEGRQVQIPSIEGYVEVSNDPELWSLANMMTAKSNILLAAYFTQKDIDDFKSGKDAEFNNYILLQTVKSLASLNGSEFSRVKEMIQTNMAKFVREAKPKINAQFDSLSEDFSNEGVDLKLKAGEIITVGKFYESDNSLGMLQLASFSGSVENEIENYTMAIATNLLYLSNRIAFLYIYKNQEDPNSLEWVKSQSLNLVTPLLANNPNNEISESLADKYPTQESTGERVVKSGVEGAIGGGFIALIAALLGFLFSWIKKLFKKKS